VKRVISVLLCAAVGVAAAPAVADAALPTGTYRCVYPENGRHFANLQVVNAEEYTFNGGRRGLYRVHGRRIEWRSGPLQHLFRHAQILRGGGREAHIDLFDGAHFGDRNDDITCRLPG
jgi:hypothetical protein